MDERKPGRDYSGSVLLIPGRVFRWSRISLASARAFLTSSCCKGLASANHSLALRARRRARASAT
jgi:hypothetical protein